MAEDCTRAFGRYLRMLRERRGLSLDEVCSLSQTFPEKITKGYLSRCENGRQKLAFVKVIPLSRIYEAPADVLVERMELDMELDRIGGPEVSGSFKSATDDAKRLLEQGRYWPAYALFRDLVPGAKSAVLLPSVATVEEQFAVALMNCATASRGLGRYRFALHEYEFLRDSEWLGDVHRALIHERIAACYRSLGHLEKAQLSSRLSIDLHESLSEKRFIGYAYATHALILFDRGEKGDAGKYFKLAYDSYRQNNEPNACPQVLNSLAQCYFDTSRYGAARRTIDTAAKLASELHNQRALGLSLILKGELDERSGAPDAAKARWQQAIEIAKRIDNRSLQFKGEYLLLRQALRSQNAPAIRAISRRMERLANSIPVDTFELGLFRELQTSPALVAAKQRRR